MATDAKPTGSDAAPSSGGDGARLSSAKEEEEEEECGFCRFMKGGSCKTAFVQWEDCVDKAKEADGDFVEKCAKQTEALRDCMMADPGYYGDMLPDEEKAGGPEDGDAKEDPSSEERKDPSTRSDEPPRARRRPSRAPGQGVESRGRGATMKPGIQVSRRSSGEPVIHGAIVV